MKFQAVITGAEGVIWILLIYDNGLFFSELACDFVTVTFMKTRRNGGKKKLKKNKKYFNCTLSASPV